MSSLKTFYPTLNTRVNLLEISSMQLPKYKTDSSLFEVKPLELEESEL